MQSLSSIPPSITSHLRPPVVCMQLGQIHAKARALPPCTHAMRAQHSRVRWLRAGVELESAAAKCLSTIDGLGLVVSHLKVGADEVHVDFAGQVQLARPVQPAESVGCVLRHARVFDDIDATFGVCDDRQVFSLHASVFMQSAPISLHSPHYICAAPVGPGVPSDPEPSGLPSRPSVLI